MNCPRCRAELRTRTFSGVGECCVLCGCCVQAETDEFVRAVGRITHEGPVALESLLKSAPTPGALEFGEHIIKLMREHAENQRAREHGRVDEPPDEAFTLSDRKPVDYSEPVKVTREEAAAAYCGKKLRAGESRPSNWDELMAAERRRLGVHARPNLSSFSLGGDTDDGYIYRSAAQVDVDVSAFPIAEQPRTLVQFHKLTSRLACHGAGHGGTVKLSAEAFDSLRSELEQMIRFGAKQIDGVELRGPGCAVFELRSHIGRVTVERSARDAEKVSQSALQQAQATQTRMMRVGSRTIGDPSFAFDFSKPAGEPIRLTPEQARELEVTGEAFYQAGKAAQDMVQALLELALRTLYQLGLRVLRSERVNDGRGVHSVYVDHQRRELARVSWLLPNMADESLTPEAVRFSARLTWPANLLDLVVDAVLYRDSPEGRMEVAETAMQFVNAGFVKPQDLDRIMKGDDDGLAHAREIEERSKRAAQLRQKLRADPRTKD